LQHDSAILTVLILTFGPVSGAHFNPAVSLAAALRGNMSASATAIYIGAQLTGAILGVFAAHLMFELPVLQISATARAGFGQSLAEAIATFGLLLTILGCSARSPAAIPYAVGLYITAAYWFTASTSFANPAGHAGPRRERYVCRHPAGGCARVHRGAIAGSGRSDRAVSLARAGAARDSA